MFLFDFAYKKFFNIANARFRILMRFKRTSIYLSCGNMKKLRYGNSLKIRDIKHFFCLNTKHKKGTPKSAYCYERNLRKNPKKQQYCHYQFHY